MQFEGEVQPCKDLWHQYQPDARRGWLKEELEEVHNEVAAWPPWKRGETMSHDARREPVTRYDPCPLCTASRPRLCDLHYQQEADAFLETVKQAIASPRTPGGVKAAYEELLAQNRALSDRLAAAQGKVDEQNAQLAKAALHIEQLEQRLAEVEREKQEAIESIYAPGSWSCPVCQFAQVNSVICATSGRVRADTESVPLCPNDGALMKRVSWKSYVASYEKTLDEKIQHLTDAQATIARLTQEREGLDVRVDSLRKHLSSTITERNQLEQQVARLRVFAEFIKDKRRKQWARWADEAEDPVSSDDEIEKLDEQFREACKALRETGAKPSNTA